jgi:class 3 adenylate cyclase/tetratricopeptide (TPR) repeat protein
VSGVREWLEGLDLGQYVEAFEANDVDMSLLEEIDDQILKDIGVKSAGHRMRLKKAIANISGLSQEPAEQDNKDKASVTPSSIEGERRQLTVMFCDMVGFTELASRVDPEILQKIIRVYEDTCAAAITRYDGYVFQRLGDGIVAFFGYPLAHEGEAERAIRAGLDIIDAFADLDVAEVGHLQVRIGIATGLVVVASAEKGAVGETMNLASRLQGIAQVDTIVVSERVRQLAGGSFEYQDLGEHSLKGIAWPTHVYGIFGVSDAASRFEAASGEALTPLVGRDLELGLLMDRWALAQDGEGQVVLLSGEPGIGKSRILSALRENLEGEGAMPIRFQCSPYYVNSAFWPSIDNFERTLRFARDESPESKLDKLEALIVEHYGRPQSDVRFIAAMLSIPCDERYGEISMTPQKFKDETLRTLVDLTEAAAKMQPSVLLFEDAHWADPTTLELLDLMIDRVKNMPLLVVLTHRPEFQNRWTDHGHVIGLNLSKLTRAQSAAMTSRVTGGKALPDDLLEQIISKTDGVPLFVEELTKSILESGELTDKGDRYEYAGTSHSIIIPATLRDSLMARLDRFMPVKEIAQIGAAIGREFSYELVSAVAPLQKTQLDDALSQLTDSGLAFRRGTTPEATYTFKHALVQDAAYDSLLKSKRQMLHARIAKVLEEHFPQTKDTEPEVLAHHLTAAAAIEAAIPLWQKAGELALRRMALSEAISHLDKGLELTPSLPSSSQQDTSELGLRTLLGTAWLGLKGWPAPEAWSSLHPALALAKSLGRNDALPPIYWGLSVNVGAQGRVAEALPWAHEMLDTAKAAGDSALLVTGHMTACNYSFWMGRLVESLKHYDKVLALYDEQKHLHLVDLLNEDPKTQAGVFASLSTWMLGYPDRAVCMLHEVLARARRIGHPFGLGWALSQGSDILCYRCDTDEQRKLLDECDQLGRENSLPVLWAVMAPGRYGMASIREGKTAEGIAPLKATLSVWDASGGKVWSPYGKSVLADAMAQTGELDDALRLIDEQIEQVERPGWEERVHYAEILRLKGWMLSLKNDLEGAEKNYLASLDWAREQKAKSWELRTSTSLARLWHQQGKGKEAFDLLKPVYDWFTEGFDTRDLKEAKALLSELQT